MAGFFGTQETKTDKLIVCLDLGTHAFKALAAMHKKNGDKVMLGLEEIESDGIKRGVIVNPARVTSLLKKLMGRLEKKIDHNIAKVYVTTGGINLVVKHNSVYRLSGRSRQFSAELIDEMEDENNRLFNPNELETLLIEPQSYKIDREIEEDNPVGSMGQRIDAEYLVLAAPKSDLNTLRKTLKDAGLQVEILPAAYASGVGVVSKNEMEVGAVVLDIGAGVSQMSLFHNGRLAHLVSIPFAGNSITNDLRKGWNIQMDQAEKLKCKFGGALPELEEDDAFVSLTGVRNWSNKMMQKTMLAHVIEARLEEMFNIFTNQIESSGYFDALGTGIVLAGGSSSMNNMLDFVKKNTGLEACLSQPVEKYTGRDAGFLSKPQYAALVGLLQEADEDCERKEGFSFFNKPVQSKPAQAKRKTAKRDMGKGFTGSLFESPQDVSFDD